MDLAVEARSALAAVEGLGDADRQGGLEAPTVAGEDEPGAGRVEERVQLQAMGEAD